MNMRALIMLAENTTARADSYIAAVNTALGHVGVTTVIYADEKGVIHLDSIDAHTPGQGEGGKALKIITGLADQYGVTMTLEVEDASDDEDEDSEGSWEDEGASSDRGLMDADDLIGWYGAYGFEVTAHTGWRYVMRRRPQPTK